MEASTLIKREILLLAFCEDNVILPHSLTEENIEECFYNNQDDLRDYICKIRKGHVETDLETQYDRYYFSHEVGHRCIDGRWVGWTYWYGDGEYSNPEDIEWWHDVYYLDYKNDTFTCIF